MKLCQQCEQPFDPLSWRFRFCSECGAKRRKEQQTKNYTRVYASRKQNPPQEKPCSVCRKKKSRNDFSKLPSSSDGLRGQCKLCINALRRPKARAYYARNRERLNQRKREWSRRNPERARQIWLCAYYKRRQRGVVLSLDHNWQNRLSENSGFEFQVWKQQQKRQNEQEQARERLSALLPHLDARERSLLPVLAEADVETLSPSLQALLEGIRQKAQSLALAP